VKDKTTLSLIFFMQNKFVRLKNIFIR